MCSRHQVPGCSFATSHVQVSTWGGLRTSPMITEMLLEGQVFRRACNKSNRLTESSSKKQVQRSLAKRAKSVEKLRQANSSGNWTGFQQNASAQRVHKGRSNPLFESQGLRPKPFNSSFRNSICTHLTVIQKVKIKPEKK